MCKFASPPLELVSPSRHLLASLLQIVDWHPMLSEDMPCAPAEDFIKLKRLCKMRRHPGYQLSMRTVAYSALHALSAKRQDKN
jgi:hypothetical protein